jgi:hypothetical protein
MTVKKVSWADADEHHQQHSSSTQMLKRFECVKCKFRCGRESNALNHIKRVHKLDLAEAKSFLSILSDDEPRQEASIVHESSKSGGVVKTAKKRLSFKPESVERACQDTAIGFEFVDKNGVVWNIEKCEVRLRRI